jgi:catechol 2,3-dioxygenase-like lactoylglutathione lyase family enzyme
VHLGRTIPALPVRDAAAAADFYRDRFGFTVRHQDDGFALLTRDDAEVHLWQADDEEWSTRPDFAANPVSSGAESFIAGTASCRIAVDEVDELYAEMSASGVLHYADRGAAQDTDFGTREFAVTDDDGNLIVFFRRR